MMSYPTAETTTAKVSGKPATLGSHLESIHAEVRELRGRLSDIADRVSGSVPQAVEAIDPVPRSHMSEAEAIRGSLSELREQVRRLDSVL
jgi:hypothetical protein